MFDLVVFPKINRLRRASKPSGGSSSLGRDDRLLQNEKEIISGVVVFGLCLWISFEK